MRVRRTGRVLYIPGPISDDNVRADKGEPIRFKTDMSKHPYYSLDGKIEFNHMR